MIMRLIRPVTEGGTFAHCSRLCCARMQNVVVSAAAAAAAAANYHFSLGNVC